MTVLTVTFRSLREAGVCVEGYQRLAKSKGGVTEWGRDAPIPLRDILSSNGLDDALWSFQACIQKDEAEKIARLFACDCAELVLRNFEGIFPADSRPRNAIEVARQFAYGTATLSQLSAAWSAASAAESAAWSAASAAAWSAASAAESAARSAASAAGWSAASAAWSAASAATWSAARSAQENLLRNYLTGVKNVNEY